MVFGSFLRSLLKRCLGDIKTIKFSIPDVGAEHVQPLHVLLKVFDLLGREVATLVNEEKPPCNYEVTFTGETRRQPRRDRVSTGGESLQVQDTSSFSKLIKNPLSVIINQFKGSVKRWLIEKTISIFVGNHGFTTELFETKRNYLTLKDILNRID